jgi:hypothetical protein
VSRSGGIHLQQSGPFEPVSVFRANGHAAS